MTDWAAKARELANDTYMPPYAKLSEHAAAIEAALAEAERRGAEGQWQDISTAPQMKTILLFAITDVQTGNWKMATGYWHNGYQDEKGWWFWDGRTVKEYDVKPTHWRALPLAPKEGEQG